MKRALLMTGAATMIVAQQGAAIAQARTGPAAAPAGTQLEQITVTASRRSENLQKTAIAVTAISGRRLEAAGVVQVRDLSKTVAGLSITASGAGSQVYLRGVGTFSTTSYAGSPIALDLDGIYLGLPAMTNGVFYDISRVETLKGPQGTLYGKNATAGAVNIFTTQPGAAFGGFLSQEIGNYGLFKTDGAVNIPITDQASLRLAGQFLNRDGYYTDKTGRTGGEGVRATFRIKPTDDITLTLGADYEHATGNEEPLVPIGANPGNPWAGPTTALSNAGLIAARNPADRYGVGLPPFYSELLPTITSSDFLLHNDNAGVRGDLDWNLDFATLSVISSYRHLTTLWYNDPGFQDRQASVGYQGSVEVRLAPPDASSRFKWQAGLYYYDNSASQHYFIDQGFITSKLQYTDTDQSAAAFGEASYEVVPNVRIVGGLRGTTETLTQVGSSADVYPAATDASFAAFLASTGVPPFVIPGVVKSSLAPIDFSVTNAATFRNISVKGGLEYDVSPTSLAYANFTTGFRSGGLNEDLNTPTASNVFKPETLEAYTIGSKNRFLDGSLQLNGEGFYWIYKNHQEIYLTESQADPSINLPLTHNIGSSTLKGASADIQYRPTQDDLLGAQVEYLDAVFNNFTYPEYTTPGIKPSTGCESKVVKITSVLGQPEALNDVNCSGKPFTRAPHWSLNLSLQHTFHLGATRGELVAFVSSKITTSEYIAVDYIPVEHEAGQTLTDLILTYQPANSFWTLSGYVRNLENTAQYSAAFEYPFASNVVFGSLSPPRTFGGIFKVRF